ncbi:MAG: glycerol-3-phosphate 1-O-acyltransferase PlsY [Candidatus Paceibacterota bacterium]|jgi:glycerol-3-phosphate acyltransferase PlsY|nr:glycerol-3-phosphate 1-O-acyltransferase PlsY [Candidatus Paceibacterota bacterium]
MEWYLVVGLCAFAYFFCSLPFGYVVARTRNVNIRESGSGNIGGTNVARALGFKYGFLVAGLDAFKGLLPLFLALYVFRAPWWAASLVFIFSIIGARYSVFLKFKGGKGVAVLVGNLLALLGWKALVMVFCYFLVVIFLTKRRVSLASLLFVSSLLVIVALFPALLYVSMALPVIAFLIWWAHKDNIKRLIRNEEPSFERLPEFFNKLPDDLLGQVIEKLQWLIDKLKDLNKGPR